MVFFVCLCLKLRTSRIVPIRTDTNITNKLIDNVWEIPKMSIINTSSNNKIKKRNDMFMRYNMQEKRDREIKKSIK